MEKLFTANTKRATVTRTSESYYVLVMATILNERPEEIGCSTKSPLVRYAQANGYTVDYIDARPKTPKYHTAINGPSDF